MLLDLFVLLSTLSKMFLATNFNKVTKNYVTLAPMFSYFKEFKDNLWSRQHSTLKCIHPNLNNNFISTTNVFFT